RACGRRIWTSDSRARSPARGEVAGNLSDAFASDDRRDARSMDVLETQQPRLHPLTRSRARFANRQAWRDLVNVAACLLAVEADRVGEIDFRDDGEIRAVE